MKYAIYILQKYSLNTHIITHTSFLCLCVAGMIVDGSLCCCHCLISVMQQGKVFSNLTCNLYMNAMH